MPEICADGSTVLVAQVSPDGLMGRSTGSLTRSDGPLSHDGLFDVSVGAFAFAAAGTTTSIVTHWYALCRGFRLPLRAWAIYWPYSDACPSDTALARTLPDQP